MFESLKVATLRSLVRWFVSWSWRGYRPPPVQTLDEGVNGPAGIIPVRRYRPDHLLENAPLLVYFHGGGFVVGDLLTHDPLCRDLAYQAGCEVVSVEYRLAPEHPFPAAVEDALAACQALRDDLPGRRPMIVGGDSAGGNLAAVVAQQLGEQLALAGQLLIYPALDHYEPATDSAREYANNRHLSRKTLIWFLDHYLPTPLPAEQETLAFPLRRASLEGLPDTLLLTAECDPLRDEGEHYAARLQTAGVNVELHRYAQQPHGFVGTSGPNPGHVQAVADIARWIATCRVPALRGDSPVVMRDRCRQEEGWQ